MATVSQDLLTFHLVVASGTNATVVAVAPAPPVERGVRLYSYYLYNNTTSPRKVAFHDTASTPTAGAGIKFVIVLPPNAAANLSFSDGILFADGLAITTVTDIPDSGNTGVTANDLVIELFYR